MRLLKVATCNLNQWSMDFDSNLNNIKESIAKAKAAGAAIRLGPELEITGFGCEDHFLELDTVSHSWKCLKEILAGDWTDGILCSIGMPLFNGPWQLKNQLVDFQLPNEISEAISQKSVPFGYGYIQFLDTAVAAEVCKELFTPLAPHDDLALNGVEIFLNASGSSHQVGKALDFRIRTLISFTRLRGGVYMYSNQRGCDGSRHYYGAVQGLLEKLIDSLFVADGCSCVVVNGEVVALGSQFSLKDVEIVVALVDLDAVAAKRASSSSFREEIIGKSRISLVSAPFTLCQTFNLKFSISSPVKISPYYPEEEIALGPACWLWDYLRRSEASGFLLPLSGGVDTSSVAALVVSISQLVIKEIENGKAQVKADAIRIGCYSDEKFPTDSKEFARRIFYTVFMGCENSAEDRRQRAKVLADEIGSWHLDVPVDSVVSALLLVFQTLTGKRPRNKNCNHSPSNIEIGWLNESEHGYSCYNFVNMVCFAQVDGGSEVENQGLQNIQDRIRTVVASTLAALLPWVHNKAGFLLVLSSSTVDDELSGRMTKYGCNSGDINPVGSINKQDIKSFLRWAATNLGYSSLAEIEAAPRIIDDKEIGMTSEELSVFGKWRRNFRLGPVSMFQNLCHKWRSTLNPSEVANKVKHFFNYYSINKHKMTVLTPFYHAEGYSPDDNRCDLRQILYNTRWPYQFRKMDEIVQELDSTKADIAVSVIRKT